MTTEDKGKTEVKNTFQKKLAEKMMGIFELVVSDRSGYFAKNPDKIPDNKSVPSIINSYSAINAALSGGLNLVPGPWGMVAVIPEIVAVIRNQLAMIYDIGMAYEKNKVLNKELLAGVLISALGSGTGSLLVMKGSQVLVRRVALQTFQKVIAMLAGKITQQALKSAISKWLPGVGAVVMAVWSNILTQQVGKKAVEIFEKEITLSGDVFEDIPLEPESGSVLTTSISMAAVPNSSYDLLKVQTLINLMKVDGTLKEEERNYVQTIIDNAGLSMSENLDLIQAIDKCRKFTIDYSVFASSFDDCNRFISGYGDASKTRWYFPHFRKNVCKEYR